MVAKIKTFLNELSLIRRYILISLVVTILGVLVIGWWVSMQITNGVVHRTSASASLYVENFIAHDLQELATTGQVLPNHLQELDQLVQTTPLGQQIVAFKVWNTSGVVQYSTDKSIIGKTFTVEGGLAQALNGEVASSISRLSRPENIGEQAFGPRLIETYIPVRLSGTDRVIAVVEFYQKIDELQNEISAAQKRSWLVVAGVMSVIFVLLGGFVTHASNTIEGQKVELKRQVTLLTNLLAQNKDLHENLRKAAASVTTLHERLLRRVGSELHDGPAQDLSLALLKVDTLIGKSEQSQIEPEKDDGYAHQLADIQSVLENAMKELRAIAGGLALPELSELSLSETIARAVRAHERRTNTSVDLNMTDLPPHIPAALKITIYRLIQEALNNSFHHADAAGQKVDVELKDNQLIVEISDQGPGFDIASALRLDHHLGINGMRERVESLGGQFSIDSQPGSGTIVKAQFNN